MFNDDIQETMYEETNRLCNIIINNYYDLKSLVNSKLSTFRAAVCLPELSNEI